MCILDMLVRLRFRNQPLSEVGLTVTFSEKLGLTPGFIFELGKAAEELDLVLGSTDTVIHTPGRAGGQGSVEIDLLKISGLQLRASNGVGTVVQQSLFRAHWNGASGYEYPRFEALLDSIEQVFKLILNISGIELHAEVVNLTYHNVLEIPEGLGIYDYFKKDLLGSAISDNPINFDLLWKDERTDIRLNFVQRFGESETKKEYEFVTIAGIRIEGSETYQDLAKQLNLTLNALFNKLITERTKQEWQLEL